MLKEQPIKEKVSLIVCAVLLAIGAINEIYTMFADKTSLVIDIVEFVLYALIIAYAAFLYKKPHGNLLKIVMMVFAFVCAFSYAINEYYVTLIKAFGVAAAVLVAFMSGRLDRFKQNKCLGAIVLAVLLVLSIVFIATSASNNDLGDELLPMADPAAEVMSMPAGEPAPQPEGGEVIAPPDGEVIAPPEGEEMAPPEGESMPGFPSSVDSIFAQIRLFDLSIMWAAIYFGYQARYRQHKEAGLIDAPKN